MGSSGDSAKGFEFKKFATPRIIGGIVIALIVLWALSVIFDSSGGPSSTMPTGVKPQMAADGHSNTAVPGNPTPFSTGHKPVNGRTALSDPGIADNRVTAPFDPGQHREADPLGRSGTTTAAAPTHQPAEPTHNIPVGSRGSDSQIVRQQTAESGHPLPATAVIAPVHRPTPKGVAFVEAAIKPLNYELEERWWGWRANDLINLTDNVNNFQMGVLEVTRRTTVALAERISRTGTTAAFDEDLEQAMNWFMVKASSYWFPSAESKYRDGLENLRGYLNKLEAGRATFYTRTDNLIPLLASFEDLLGSCDENLVKEVGEDDEPIGFLTVDDYFYYTQGVASSMATVLQAVHHDFLLTLESRNATELLHHAIVSCERASKIDPLIVLDRNLSSIFANHRANMAAPISHARFYLGQLIKTLST